MTFRHALFVSFALTSSSFAAISGSDDFNDNSKNTAKWGADLASGGVLTETGGELRYTAASTAESESYRPWILNAATYDSFWEVTLDLKNTFTPTAINKITSIGMEVFAPGTAYNKSVYLELYSSSDGALPFRRGFKSALYQNDVGVGYEDDVTGSQTGSIRLRYNPGTHVFTSYYDADGSANGYSWTQLASFGIGGTGGANGNASWGMSGSQAFQIAIYGYSVNTTVTNGQMAADNFFAATSVYQPTAWQQAQFGNDAWDPAISGPLADPDHDGLVNLVERAFNLLPLQGGTPILVRGTGTSGLPSIATTQSPNGPILTIQYVRLKASVNSGLTYTPQFSSALGVSGWSGPTGSETVESINSDWERVTVTDGPPPISSPRFGRVKVTEQP